MEQRSKYPQRKVQASEFAMGEAARFTVEFAEWDGKWKLSIREWYKDADGEWRPSRNGCSLPAAAAEGLADALDQQLARFERVG